MAPFFSERIWDDVLSALKEKKRDWSQGRMEVEETRVNSNVNLYSQVHNLALSFLVTETKVRPFAF